MAEPITDGFNSQDDDLVISILKKWTGGPLSDKLFSVLAGMLPQVCVETVVLRQNGSEIEVLLMPRATCDPFWPGVLHSVGSVLRTMDFHRQDHTPMNGPFERVQQHEIMTNFSQNPQYSGQRQYLGARGPEVVFIYAAQIPAGSKLPPTAIWCKVNQLSQMPNFMSHQLETIQMAASSVKIL